MLDIGVVVRVSSRGYGRNKKKQLRANNCGGKRLGIVGGVLVATAVATGYISDAGISAAYCASLV